MRVVALPKSFYRAAALQTAEPSPLANERLRELRRWWTLRASGFTLAWRWKKFPASVDVPRERVHRHPSRRHP